MADEKAQGPEDGAWGTVAALPDPSLPAMGFDEPLVWPESPVWDDMAGPEASDRAHPEIGEIFRALPEMADLAAVTAGATGATRAAVPDGATVAAAEPTPDADAQWRPTEDELDPETTVQHVGPLAALGGGSGPAPSQEGAGVPWPVGADEPHLHGGSVDASPVGAPLLGSIWSNDLRANPRDLVGFGDVAAPPVYADTERNARGPRWRRFDVRPGNTAVIGLISVVSLVLLGMFLSVRARNNDVPTDSSQSRPTANEVSATGPLNTVPQSTTVPTTAPPPVINLSELVPAAEAAAAAESAGGGTAAAATTTPTARTASPSGGNSATTTPVTQATATTAPPTPTTEATAAPAAVEEETSTTVRRPTPTFTIPNITIPNTAMSIPRHRMPFIDKD